MRPPAVEGLFYPSVKEKLFAAIKRLFLNVQPHKSPCHAIICPHAGYIYSGHTAAFSYAAASNLVDEDITAIIIGPNHTGRGELISISQEDWLTPLGISKCDTELANDIFSFSYTASLDEIAHLTEHSIEVQLPFLQKLNPKAKIVCISMMAQNLEASLDIGKAIFEATKNRNVIVIASSDFTHYKSAEQASVLDASALEKIQTLEVEGFQREVESKNLSICGYGPISAAMHYSKLKGAKMAELLRYSNSGEVTGDYSNVVAYASLAIRK